MKVAARIYTGFGIVLALLVVVAGVGWWSSRSATHEFATYAAISDDATTLTMVARNAVGMRRNVLAFIANGDPKVLERFSALRVETHATLGALRERAGDEPQRKALDRMKDLLGIYAATFDKVVALRRERDGLIFQGTDQTGPAGTEQIGKLFDMALAHDDLRTLTAAGQIRNLFAGTRLALLRYQGRQDDANAADALRLADETVSAITALQTEQGSADYQATIAEIAKTVGAYRDSLGRQIEVTRAYSSMVGTTMVEAAENFGKLADDTVAQERKELEGRRDDTQDMLSGAQTFGTVFSLIALVLGLGAATIIARGIVRPVSAMTDAMGRLADGDKTIAVPALERRDELGAMAKAVQVFKDNAIRMEALQAEQEEQKRQAEIARRQMMLDLADDFERSVGGVVQAVSGAATEMQSQAQGMGAASEQASRQATAVAAASEEASANVQTVASAADELAASISEIARQVAQASDISGRAVTQAEDTGTTVRTLAEAANRIGQVVDLIRQVADQTNLLALNATIEAARAGDAGKGFAVVANEVKNLASQTARATEEITRQIVSVQDATEESVRAIGAIRGTIDQINQISGSIAAAVEEQSAATQEIARNVQEAASGTEAVSVNIAGVTEAAAEVGAVASQVNDAAGELARQGARLTSEVENFLAQVRAG